MGRPPPAACQRPRTPPPEDPVSARVDAQVSTSGRTLPRCDDDRNCGLTPLRLGAAQRGGVNVGPIVEHDRQDVARHPERDAQWRRGGGAISPENREQIALLSAFLATIQDCRELSPISGYGSRCGCARTLPSPPRTSTPQA